MPATEFLGRALSRRKTSPTSGKRERTRDAAAIRVASNREAPMPSTSHNLSHRPGPARLNMFQLPPLSSMARFSNPTPARRPLSMLRRGPTIRAWCQTRDIRLHTQTCSRLELRLASALRSHTNSVLVPAAACPAALPSGFQRHHGYVWAYALCDWPTGQLATPGFQPDAHFIPASC